MFFTLYLLLSLGLGCVASHEVYNLFEPRASISASSLPASVIATAWYAGWHATDQPLSAVSWSKYNVMNYAFGITTADPAVVSLEASDQILLTQFVTMAHTHNVKASLSIGGWTGSRFFSSNVGSSHNRTAFVGAVTGLVEEYKLDGVDFDWEYPAIQGIGCNTVNSNDTANFLSFLQELRQSLGSSVIISAATDLKPFPGPSGAPFDEIAKFGDVLDYIVIMNYDIPSTPTSGVGSNSPLNDNCAPLGNQNGSAQSAITAWASAGMPNDRIVLGAPMYGHSYRVPKSAAYTDQSRSSLALSPSYNGKPTGDKWNGDGGLNVCGVYESPGGTYAFWSLVDNGFLNADGSEKQGITYRYDACSQTPYVYNSTSEILIAYDNAQSFAAKGDFIKTNELRGFAVWESAGDYNDILINAILNGTINGAPGSANTSPQPSTATSKKSSSALQMSTFSWRRWVPALGLIYICGWFHV